MTKVFMFGLSHIPTARLSLVKLDYRPGFDIAGTSKCWTRFGFWISKLIGNPGLRIIRQSYNSNCKFRTMIVSSWSNRIFRRSIAQFFHHFSELGWSPILSHIVTWFESTKRWSFVSFGAQRLGIYPTNSNPETSQGQRYRLSQPWLGTLLLWYFATSQLWLSCFVGFGLDVYNLFSQWECLAYTLSMDIYIYKCIHLDLWPFRPWLSFVSSTY